MQHDAVLILVAGVLLATGVFASLGAARVRLPALVVFLGIGMVIGTDGLGWIDFSDYCLARRRHGGPRPHPVRGRASTRAPSDPARPSLGGAPGGRWARIVTALVAGLFAAWLFDLIAKEGLLLGAILSATDGAAVFALMRGSHLPAPAGADARGRGGVQRSGRRPPGGRRWSSWSRRPATARSTAASTSCGSSASGRSRAPIVGIGAGRAAPPAGGRAVGPASASGRPRSPRSHTGRRARSAARASSRSTWPASCSATASSRPARRSTRFTRAWRQSPRSGCSWRSGCWSSRANSATSSSRARCSG